MTKILVEDLKVAPEKILVTRYALKLGKEMESDTTESPKMVGGESGAE